VKFAIILSNLAIISETRLLIGLHAQEKYGVVTARDRPDRSGAAKLLKHSVKLGSKVVIKYQKSSNTLIFSLYNVRH